MVCCSSLRVKSIIGPEGRRAARGVRGGLGRRR
jgi:hypothetical protein